MGPEEGSLALEKLCGLAFVSRAQGRGGIGMMTTGVSIPLGSFNGPGLLLAAVLFSVGIGLGSGYYPANKAVQISALEAIKTS